MGTTLRVTAPYVTLKVQDPMAGGSVVRGFYEGAIVEHVDDESALHHLENGLAEEASVDDQPAGPPLEPEALNPPEEPAGNASRDEWAAFAASKGATAEDLTDKDGKDLTRDELKAKYGS